MSRIFPSVVKMMGRSSHRMLSSTCRLQAPSENRYTVVSQTDGIRKITLNDPKKRNALSLGMLQQLQKDVSAVDDSLRVIVLSHTGPVFSAGHDLKELDIPVPVIAQVNGLATAAGCQLVASCDIAVVTENSKFATPGVQVGLFCSTPAVAVGRSVPRKVAMEMLFTGQPISAQDALLHGLVSRVVPEGKLEEETTRIAMKICEFSKSVITLGKRTFYKQIALDRKLAYSLTEKVMVDNLALKDGQEGIKAFVEKRKPVWSHDDDTAH
ncbi:enoyl-CoA hydratase domain-containing protein 3, mitochondrial-like isoform X2 [Dreissena polymorpha]|uniref:enoyl-CoA hydratase domain-containing protein 3, mitochondrial-like isoform X2 n=1 Tax=Dreissena polymorpha TaxID=45954 RepID=UPI002264508C|nr:enoyl-CoA hydratase domain-containing protein 3, mitochondrial-like isoform X2 [Dreissena polymorpha]